MRKRERKSRYKNTPKKKNAQNAPIQSHLQTNEKKYTIKPVINFDLSIYTLQTRNSTVDDANRSQTRFIRTHTFVHTKIFSNLIWTYIFTRFNQFKTGTSSDNIKPSSKHLITHTHIQTSTLIRPDLCKPHVIRFVRRLPSRFHGMCQGCITWTVGVRRGDPFHPPWKSLSGSGEVCEEVHFLWSATPRPAMSSISTDAYPILCFEVEDVHYDGLPSDVIESRSAMVFFGFAQKEMYRRNVFYWKSSKMNEMILYNIKKKM